MTEKLRVGIIGVGCMSNLHANCYMDIPEVEITGICDIVKDRAEEFRKAHNLSQNTFLCENFKELITRNDIDIINITTPNYTHSDIAIAAMRSGKHVFIEKPDCTTVKEAEEMKMTAEQTGKVLMVMRNNRWYEPSLYAKKLITDGKAGTIYSGRCGWIRRRGIPGKGGWYTTKSKSGGGPLIDLGVHMIDLAIWLLGNPLPISVSGCTYAKFTNSDTSVNSVYGNLGEPKSDGVFDVEDLAMGFIRFNNGACLQIEFSWASNIERDLKFVELRGTKAGLAWTGKTNLAIFTEDEYKNSIDITPDFQFVNGHARNIQHFINVVLKKEEPDFIPDQGVNMIKILTAVYESAKIGKEVIL
ncbi:MAG: gfo/Idh/MocA family oxidoreductase [Clostridiales bacterium]|nr:MAG: gfo/Idh/MocA family oxidoreductase [Clostridiales bacterium]